MVLDQLLHLSVATSRSLSLDISQVSAVVLVLFLIYYFIVYPAVLSPLARIPAPHWSCHVAPFWYWSANYFKYEMRAVFKGHKRKGSVLRIAPNQLSVNCYEDGLNTIYLGNFPRSDFYPNGFSFYGVGNMFTTTNTTVHGLRRRRFTNLLTKSNILASASAREVFKTIIFDRLLPLIRDNASNNTPIEVLGLSYAYSMDSFTGWQFGVASGSNFIQDETQRNHYLKCFFEGVLHMFEFTQIPKFVHFLRKFGIRLVPRRVEDGLADNESWHISMCDKAAKVVHDGVKPALKDQPVVFAQALETMAEKSGMPSERTSADNYPNRLEIASEMFGFNVAAFETSGDIICYVLYELSRHPSIQTKIRQELRSIANHQNIPTDFDFDIPIFKDLDALPFLDSVIMETLRLYPSVPGAQPRTTPSTTSLGGYDNIPAGVTVQSYAYSLHRNAEVFPDPESWLPARWLEASPTELNTMRKWFWAFGSGASMCIGSHFAMLTMKLFIASIYTNFTTCIYEHGDMELADDFTGGPRGKKLLLKFSHI